MVAYQKLVTCKDDVGVERALGSTFFSHGGFLDHNMYEMYNQKVRQPERYTNTPKITLSLLADQRK